MRWFLAVLSCLVVFFGGGSTKAYASHEIASWKGGRSAAVSVTFDDAIYSQATKGAEVLNARGLEGTFFLLTKQVPWNGGWGVWAGLAQQGHEMASHTINHPHLPEIPVTEAREELSESQAVIDQNITSQAALTVAYPFGETNETIRTMASEYYLAGRGTWSSDDLNHYPGGDGHAVDFMVTGSFPMDDPVNASLTVLNNRLDSAEAYDAWFCVYMHDIDDEKEQRLGLFLDEAMARDVWIAPYGEVVRYMRERINGCIDVIYESASEIELEVTTSGLDNSIFNLPVTVRSTVPTDWYQVEVVQGSTAKTIGSVAEGGERVVYYEAMPNSDVIELYQANASECIDLDGDGYGDPASSSCPYQGLDCNDGPDHAPICLSCSCNEAACKICAKCAYPGAKENPRDGYDSNCSCDGVVHTKGSPCDACFIGMAAF